jgi:hypothetical protein
MNDNEGPARDWDHALDRLAAAATIAAYAVALQHGATSSWADLELGLWDVMARTVRDWAGRPVPGPEPRGYFSR